MKVRNQQLCLSTVILLFSLVGCSSNSTEASRPATEDSSKEARPLVDNPEFLHWNQFPVGSKVVRNRASSNGKSEVFVTTTMTIVDKSADKITVDQQVTVLHPDTSDGPGSKLENPPQSLEYAAKFRLPESVSLESFSMPSIKAKKVESEKIRVLDQEYDADVFEWFDSSERGLIKIKLWRNEKVPGRLLKEETILDGQDDRSFEELVEINLPK
jgi:hypothetical protein